MDHSRARQDTKHQGTFMRPDEIVHALRQYAEASVSAADKCLELDGRCRMTMMASVLMSAADEILQLQQRLVKQACYFEYIEAANEPKNWPLLADDEDDPGASL